MDSLSVILFGLIALIALLPWHAFLHFVNGQQKWSNADLVTWSHVWMTDIHTKDVGAAWVSDLGGNWACEMERETCRQVMQEEAVKEYPFSATPLAVERWQEMAVSAILDSPLMFMQNRASYWSNTLGIGNSGTFAVTPDRFGSLRLLVAIVILVAWLVTTVRSCLGRIPVAYVSLIFIGVAAGTNLLQHLEARYAWASVILAAAALSVVSMKRVNSSISSLEHEESPSCEEPESLST
jgi:hypothetical protein